MPWIHRVLAASLTAALGVVPSWADHARDFDQALGAFTRAKDLRKAEKVFLEDARASGRNQLLSLYELAGFYQWEGDSARSATLFAKADEVAHGYEGRALVSVSGGMSQAGATLTNDSLLHWEGATFHKVMSRTLNALNYLALGDLEGARVEVRKAEEYQVRERERIQGKVQRASARDAAGPVTMDSRALASEYGGMASYVKGVRSSYENAFTYYLSSLIYRAQGSDGFDDALVDIKRAYALAPESQAVRTAYLSLASRAMDGAALEDLKRRLGAEAAVPPAAASTGMVIVIYEAGVVPRMTEVSIDVPIPRERPDRTVETYLLSMAFPIYKNFGSPEPPLRVRAGLDDLATSRVADLRPLAVKELQERMPMILARSMVGAAAKIEAQKKAEELGGVLAKFAAELATKVVTRADLRSWMGLPAEIQALEFHLPPGAATVTLMGGAWSENVNLNVVSGGTTFLTVRAFPGFRAVKTTALKPPL